MVYVYEDIADLPSSFESRVLVLGDNETLVFTLNKGRGGERTLLGLCRHALAVSIARRTRTRSRLLEGLRQPCDSPTRPGGLSHGAAAVVGVRPSRLGPSTVCRDLLCPPRTLPLLRRWSTSLSGLE